MGRLYRVSVIFFLCALFLFGASLSSSALQPTEEVKQTIDEVLTILSNDELKRPEKGEHRRALLRKVIGDRFDYTEMARRSLATHWTKRSPAEQKEFVGLFRRLLENSYVTKIEAYSSEKILYTKEILEGGFAEVKTKIVTRQGEIPIDYRLANAGGRWMIYDVVIEGVSLVNNYRTQFNKIIRSSSFNELVEKLRKKSEELTLLEKSP